MTYLSGLDLNVNKALYSMLLLNESHDILTSKVKPSFVNDKLAKAWECFGIRYIT